MGERIKTSDAVRGIKPQVFSLLLVWWSRVPVAHGCRLNRLSVSFKEGHEFKAILLYKVGVKEITLTKTNYSDRKKGEIEARY